MAAFSDPGQRILDKKRTVLLLRSVVVICTSYLILFGPRATSLFAIAYILSLILSNIALAFTPNAWFQRPGFSAALLLGDTAVVLVGLYLTVGCFSQDFLIIYFFTIFLTTATEGVVQIALGAAMVSTLYGYWLWMSSGHTLGAGEWLRLPFFFIVAVFYAYMTEETKQERWRRQQAEHERERLRCLLMLGDALEQGPGNPEWVAQLGHAIETVLPGLVCQVSSAASAPSAAGRWFPFCAHGETFGGLHVTPTASGELTENEAQFCRLVSLVVGNALYADRQTRAANDSARLKEEFLGTLSHELRTPLHAILGFVDLIEGSAALRSDDMARENVARLRANASHLQDLLSEMLWFAELRAGEQTVQVERIDLRQLFAEFANTMDRELAGRPIRFEWQVTPEAGAFHTDRRKLKQMLAGLLSNAAKFTQRGAIWLSAKVVGDAVEISVSDSGIGIEPGNLGLIFEEFRQLDASVTRQVDGLGLGLALTRELTIVLGGQMEVDSQPQRGTTFRIRLPLHPQQRAATGATKVIAWPLPELAPAQLHKPRS